MSDLTLILGDGQMALVMADAIAARGESSRGKGPTARIWGPLADDAHRLAETRISPRLPELRLADAVEVVVDDAQAFEGASLIISAIPTQYLRSVWVRLRRHTPASIPIVSVTKGIENGTLMRPTEVIADALGRADDEIALCALSGPSIAAELARRMPASLVAASTVPGLAERVQDLLRVPWLRIYSHDDVIGVEVAGAAKNVIALAAGMIDGLKAGDNAKSALLARGLAEIARLGGAMGGRLETFFGMAGVGDLATTCFSPVGRNRRCGERLAQGETLEQVLSTMSSVVEGVPTTRSVMQFARAHNVEMPITAAVHAILFEGLTPRDAIRDLMSREPKAEQVG